MSSAVFLRHFVILLRYDGHNFWSKEQCKTMMSHQRAYIPGHQRKFTWDRSCWNCRSPARAWKSDSDILPRWASVGSGNLLYWSHCLSDISFFHGWWLFPKLESPGSCHCHFSGQSHFAWYKLSVFTIYHSLYIQTIYILQWCMRLPHAL